MYLAVSPQSFSVLRQHIVYTAAMATALAELSTAHESESSFWKYVLVFVCLYEMHVSSFMWVHACACVWVLVCMCGGEKRSGQYRMFSSLAPHLIFWDVFSQCGVPSFSCTAAHQAPHHTWPPVPAFLELDIQMCAAMVACLHGHWGSKLRSVGLCGKMTGWAVCPPPNFLFKGVRTWRWFFYFIFFKFAFHTIYFDRVFSTPNTSQVLQKTNKWWNLKQTSNNPVRQNHQSQTKSQSVFASDMVWSYKFYKQKWPGLIWVSTLVLKGGNEICEELRPSGGSKQPSLQTLSLDLELLHLQNCER